MIRNKVFRPGFISCMAVGILAVAHAAEIAAPTAPEPATRLGAVIGEVTTSAGTPVARAIITALKADGSSVRAALSGVDGVFALADLPTGAWALTAKANASARTAPATAEVVAGDAVRLDIVLDAPTNISSATPHVDITTAGDKAGPPSPDTASLHTPAAAFDKPVAALGIPDPSPKPQSDATTPSAPPVTPAAEKAPAIPDALQAPESKPGVDTKTPFAFGDFTWLNGTSRNHDTVLETKFFTPEVRFDTNYIKDFNQPIDHTIGGSTEEFRSGEVQVEQASVGGDFHWQNIRGRILFMMGLFATTTPRNDASSATGSAPGNTGGIGQWDLQNAYKYVSEAYGGYHFNVNHGLNIDAGIFVSYIGLFSYYNFDNWAYQPSYVSSNTPWFFNGVRIQWFPTNKLKIEPWFINGWQSYAKYNSHPGLGGQILWMPKEWLKVVGNQYGYGQDNLGLPNTQRIHTDDSVEVRYYNNPDNGGGISKMAFSLTVDAGCQYGGGINCTHGPNKSSFLGGMLYNRIWWHHDLFAVTLGGGLMNNTGRYLTLLPPINGAWAASGSVYFPENPGLPAHMWDSTITFHYMPRQYLTWWAEVGYRHSDVPYFSGRGGITPPGGNNGLPQYYTCMSGASSGTADLAAAQLACGGASNVWFPDLRRSTSSLGFGVMVKF